MGYEAMTLRWGFFGVTGLGLEVWFEIFASRRSFG